MPDSPDKRKKKKKPAAGTPSSNSSPDLSPKLRVRSAPIDFGEPKAAFTSTAVESRTPSVQPPTQSFDVTLRAERAEAAAVELRAQLQSRTVEAHTSLIDIRHADDLTAACEASLKWQLRQVANYMAELSHERAVGGEQREALTHAAQQIEELQAVVAHLEKQLEAERTSAAAAKAKYHEQGDVWRTGAERIRDERAADAVRKVERYRVWEHTIAKWLEDGRNKKLDPVLHGENLGIYERLAAMITDEILILERQQQAWDETLSAQKQAEVDALEAQLADARGALDALNKTRTALEKKTEQVLHAFFAGEVAELQTRNKALAQQLGNERDKARVAWEQLEKDAKQRRADAKEGLGHLSAAVQSVEAEMAEVVRQREALAENDPRHLLQQERERRERLEKLATEERAAREAAEAKAAAQGKKVEEVQAALRRRDEEIARRSLEFGEKAHLQLSVEQLRAKASAAEGLAEGVRQHYDQVLELAHLSKEEVNAQLLALRHSARQMTLSLAHYANKEVEWATERETREAALDRFRAELKPLRKKAKKVEELEARLQASTHDALEKERADNFGLRRQVQELEGRLGVAHRERARDTARLSAELDTARQRIQELEAQIHCAEWEAQESKVNEAAQLRAQQDAVKEGLAKRITAQWARSCVMRCWKAWSVYTLKRQLTRQVAPESLSDEEPPEPDSLLGKVVHQIGGLF